MERLVGPDRITLRAASVADAHAVAAFHVAVWRETYLGIAPSDAYTQLDAARRLPGWLAKLAAPDVPPGTIVAEDSGGLVGLVSFGPPGLDLYGKRGEVHHLYVASAVRGRGLGRRLLIAAFGHLRDAGYGAVGLSVVRENAAARRAYAALGGTEVAAFRDPGPLWRSDNILVDWSGPALNALITPTV